MPQDLVLPAFYPILDTASLRAYGVTALEIGKALVAEGVRILQFRHKDDWTQQDYDEAAELAGACREAGCLFVVNDRADYAHLAGSALHIGQDDLSPVAARKVVPDAIVGLSTHNRKQLEDGMLEPIDYVALGPVFATHSKLNPDPVLGIQKFGALAKTANKPLVAIGGITLQNAGEVLVAGASSVAIISGFLAEGGVPAIARSARAWLAVARG